MSEPKNFENYITELVGESAVYVVDSESVDAVEDYKTLIEDLFELSDGELKLESFSGDEGIDIWQVTLGVNGAEHQLTLDYNRGWVDNANLVPALNEILSANASTKRFCWFWAADSFGQEIGFFCASPEHIKSVFKYAQAKNKRANGVAMKMRQVSDGINEEGLEDV